MPLVKAFPRFFLNPYKTDKYSHWRISRSYPNTFNVYLRKMVIEGRGVDEEKFSRALDIIFEDFGEKFILQFGSANFDPQDLLEISNNKLLFIALDKILLELMKAGQGAAIIKQGELFYKIFAKAALNYRNDPSQASPTEFVKIIDKHFKEKEIPAEFLFENEKSTGKSFAPEARLSPVGALEGNPWPASCSPGLELQKRTIVLQGSFFEGVGEDDVAVLKKQFKRLINEGFEIVYFEGDEVKKVEDVGELSLGNLPDVDAKKAAQILAKKSIAISEVVILNGDNRAILQGVFFNELELFYSQGDEKLKRFFLEIMVQNLDYEYNYSTEKPNKDNIVYLVRNNIKLTAQQMGELQEIVSLKGGNSNYKHVLHIFFNAVLADNAEVLEVLCNGLNKIAQDGLEVMQGADLSAAGWAIECARCFTNMLVGPHEKIVRTLSDNFTYVLYRDRISEIKQYYNFELAKRLLESYGDKEKKHKDVMGLWLHAVRAGDVGLFTLLRDHAVPIKEEEKPLYLISAVTLGHRKIVEMMLEMGVDVNAKNSEGDTALIAAIASGDRDIAELLIKKLGVISEEEKSKYLISAAYGGHRKIVEMMLEMGADVNANVDNRRALIGAILSGDKDIVELLIAKKAAIVVKDGDKNSALKKAVICGHIDIAELLIKELGGINDEELRSLLFVAVSSSSSSVDMVRMLLDYGAKVNAEDIDGVTPLMYAV